MPVKNEVELRRFAMRIVSELPRNKAQAVLVLTFIRELVAWENGAVVEAVDKIIRIGGG